MCFAEYDMHGGTSSCPVEALTALEPGHLRGVQEEGRELMSQCQEKGDFPLDRFIYFLGRTTVREVLPIFSGSQRSVGMRFILTLTRAILVPMGQHETRKTGRGRHELGPSECYQP